MPANQENQFQPVLTHGKLLAFVLGLRAPILRAYACVDFQALPLDAA